MTHKLLVVGFSDEAGLVRSAAKLLRAKAATVKTSSYRAGEMSLVGPTRPPKNVVVVANVWEDPASLYRILLLAESLRTAGAKTLTLLAPWIAYGRQDRAVHPGEAPAGVVLAHLLSHAFDRIVTLDAHSETFMRAFHGKLVNVLPDAKTVTRGGPYDLIVAPDAGAKSRAERVAKALGVPSVVIAKKREDDSVVSTLDMGRANVVTGSRVLLVDDMADSGGTLAAASCALKTAGASAVEAFVTHAFDLKRLAKMLKPNIRKVRTAFDHAKKNLDPAALASMLLTLKTHL